jgi:hypothetical protein
MDADTLCAIAVFFVFLAWVTAVNAILWARQWMSERRWLFIGSEVRQWCLHNMWLNIVFSIAFGVAAGFIIHLLPIN